MIRCCGMLPFFIAQTLLQVLDLALQLRDPRGGSRLALHVGHTTPQLLQLQGSTRTQRHSAHNPHNSSTIV